MSALLAAAREHDVSLLDRVRMAEIEGKVVGFCNRFCRDKSVADADAWPKLAPLLA